LKAYLRIGTTDTIDDVLLAQIVDAVEDQQYARLRPDTFVGVPLHAAAQSTTVGEFLWDKNPGIGDPGVGKLMTDSPLTTLSISHTDALAVDVSAILAAILVNDVIVLQRNTSAIDWTSTTVLEVAQDNTTYSTIRVVVKTNSATNPPKPNDQILVGVVREADVPPLTVTVPDDVYQAALMRGARLYARRASPEGLVPFGDLGVARIPAFDRDIDALEAPSRNVVLA